MYIYIMRSDPWSSYSKWYNEKWPLEFIFQVTTWTPKWLLVCWLYNIKSLSPYLWVISSQTCESYQVLCILIWLRWSCCIVKLVSNIKSSILIESTLWEWISKCGDDLVLYQYWSLVMYQDSGPPFVEVVILCDIFLVTVTKCYKSGLDIPRVN